MQRNPVFGNRICKFAWNLSRRSGFNNLKIAEDYFGKKLNPEDSSARKIGNLKDRHGAEVPLSLRSFWGFADERPWRREPWWVLIWSKLGQRSVRSDKCTKESSEIFFFISLLSWSKLPRATNGWPETFGFRHYIRSSGEIRFCMGVYVSEP